MAEWKKNGYCWVFMWLHVQTAGKNGRRRNFYIDIFPIMLLVLCVAVQTVINRFDGFSIACKSNHTNEFGAQQSLKFDFYRSIRYMFNVYLSMSRKSSHVNKIILLAFFIWKFDWNLYFTSLIWNLIENYWKHTRKNLHIKMFYILIRLF